MIAADEIAAALETLGSAVTDEPLEIRVKAKRGRDGTIKTYWTVLVGHSAFLPRSYYGDTLAEAVETALRREKSLQQDQE